jgi:hypothetical protein
VAKNFQIVSSLVQIFADLNRHKKIINKLSIFRRFLFRLLLILAHLAGSLPYGTFTPRCNTPPAAKNNVPAQWA